MAVERTFSIVKPDAVAKNVIGDIYSRFEKNGLRIVASKMLHLTQEQAEGFYAVHSERPFFNDLAKVNSSYFRLLTIYLFDLFFLFLVFIPIVFFPQGEHGYSRPIGARPSPPP